MLTKQRKEWLLARLAAEGQIVAKTCSDELGLSEDTIRRDLRELAQEGKLQRVHGGALPASIAVGDMAVRQQIAPAEKLALGKAGAAMVKEGQLVILDGGTTAIQIARHLPDSLRATIVTHSPAVAIELASHPHLEIIMLGGKLFRHSMVNVGASVIDSASRFFADTYFMGVTGVHIRSGLSTGDFEEAAVKRALHERSAETVVLASGEKLGAASQFAIAPLAGIATLVLPPGTPAKTVKMFAAAGPKVVLAS